MKNMFIILASSHATYHGMLMFNMDPHWSEKLAAQHCSNKDWVSMDTTLFYTVYRDTAALAGNLLILTFYINF